MKSIIQLNKIHYIKVNIISLIILFSILFCSVFGEAGIKEITNDEIDKIELLWADSSIHSNYVWSISWSPDGKQIATASFDKTIRIWDASTGDVIRSLIGHTRPVRGIAYSPDGSKIATCSEDRTVKIWESSTGLCLLNISAHDSGVFCVIWSPNGTWVASAGGHDSHSTELGDKKIKIWDVTTGENIKTLVGHTDGVYSLSWTFDGKRLASSSNDRAIKIWDVKTGGLLNTLTGHLSPIRSVMWSPNGTLLLSGGADSTVRIWDAQTGKNVKILLDSNPIRSICWSPDGKYIASSGRYNSLKIWDFSSGQELKNFSESIDGVCKSRWSPDGNKIAVCSAGAICSGGYNSVKMYSFGGDEEERIEDKVWDKEWLPGSIIMLTIAITASYLILLPRYYKTKQRGKL